MRTAEYNKFKSHILEYMDKQELAETLANYKTLRESNGTTWGAGQTMVQWGCFACYYSQVIEALKEIYGEEYKPEIYETKAGDLRWKNGEAYCWTIYKAKIARTLETMERKGEL